MDATADGMGGDVSDQRQRLDTTAKMRAWSTRSEVGRRRQSFQSDQRRTGEVLRTRRARREKRTYVPTLNRSHLRFTKPYKRKSDQDLPIADAALMELERFFQDCDKKEKESRQDFIDTHPLPMPPVSSHRDLFQRMNDFLANSQDEDLIKQSRLKLLQTYGLLEQENANVRELHNDLKEVYGQRTEHLLQLNAMLHTRQEKMNAVETHLKVLSPARAKWLVRNQRLKEANDQRLSTIDERLKKFEHCANIMIGADGANAIPQKIILNNVSLLLACAAAEVWRDKQSLKMGPRVAIVDHMKDTVKSMVSDATHYRFDSHLLYTMYMRLHQKVAEIKLRMEERFENIVQYMRERSTLLQAQLNRFECERLGLIKIHRATELDLYNMVSRDGDFIYDCRSVLYEMAAKAGCYEMKQISTKDRPSNRLVYRVRMIAQAAVEQQQLAKLKAANGDMLDDDENSTGGSADDADHPRKKGVAGKLDSLNNKLCSIKGKKHNSKRRRSKKKREKNDLDPPLKGAGWMKVQLPKKPPPGTSPAGGGDGASSAAASNKYKMLQTRPKSIGGAPNYDAFSPGAAAAKAATAGSTYDGGGGGDANGLLTDLDNNDGGKNKKGKRRGTVHAGKPDGGGGKGGKLGVVKKIKHVIPHHHHGGASSLVNGGVAESIATNVPDRKSSVAYLPTGYTPSNNNMDLIDPDFDARALQQLQKLRYTVLDRLLDRVELTGLLLKNNMDRATLITSYRAEWGRLNPNIDEWANVDAEHRFEVDLRYITGQSVFDKTEQSIT